MGYFAAYRRRQNQLSFYQTPSESPTSWGKVREDIESASNRDFVKRIKHLDPGTSTRAHVMFLKRPKNGAPDPVQRPGTSRTRPLDRPGFLQGLSDRWFRK